MRRDTAVLLLCVGCSNATADLSSRTEPEELGRVQHQLAARLEGAFGEGSRVQQIFGRGNEVFLGVTRRPRMEGTDVRPGLALARYSKSNATLEVLAEQEQFREARQLPSGLALVTTEGELKLRRPDGTEQTVARSIRGDISAAPRGSLLATAEKSTGSRGDSAVILTDSSGRVGVVADGRGVDDRASVSPDNHTVVFVSGRTGIASLWRTTLDGSEPIQVTNVGIQAGRKRSGPPEGFVPPPMTLDRLEWLSADELRYDAGGGNTWTVNVRTGQAREERAPR